ncbi:MULTISPECIES: stability/partitioning determinant [unclassified Pseudomonas]|uniref:stability/partitioning determinant n=1 Tax=unclassified Pseudomonas TaxID=196821 RepID=UPI002AB45F98|nr:MULTISPECIES: stability/partitioning determinant [unclassified Pseudomonas]MDY7563454.1 stability/partitioning determinant [Pseudomonas sp. AB6]MEA9980065.1 stability/partitioning determinant [Pseudomonas sp. RTS4]MEA9996445.1 stability/partitioning determinant [Pseudomonas sp. AA4]MEB0198194.1 stability/partitioning determinant [Pseudomonas sp. 5S4]MEB0213461.1 stability/partitioning determinant [Pseudomonas sp. AB6]
MTEKPVDPFANLNLGNFQPKTESQRPADKEVIEKISKDNNFPSREAPAPKPAKRSRFNASEPRTQFNIKVTEECKERFYSMAERRGIKTLGDLMDLALDALEAADRLERKGL